MCYKQIPKSIGPISNPALNEFTTSNPYFYPVHSRTPILDRFQVLVERDLTDLYQQNLNNHFKKKNLTKGDGAALFILKRNADITIRTADKGGNIIILDSGLYGYLNQSMLSDIHTYRLLDHYPTSLYSAQLAVIVSTWAFLVLNKLNTCVSLIRPWQFFICFLKYIRAPLLWRV